MISRFFIFFLCAVFCLSASADWYVPSTSVTAPSFELIGNNGTFGPASTCIYWSNWTFYRNCSAGVNMIYGIKSKGGGVYGLSRLILSPTDPCGVKFGEFVADYTCYTKISNTNEFRENLITSDLVIDSDGWVSVIQGAPPDWDSNLVGVSIVSPGGGASGLWTGDASSSHLISQAGGNASAMAAAGFASEGKWAFFRDSPGSPTGAWILESPLVGDNPPLVGVGVAGYWVKSGLQAPRHGVGDKVGTIEYSDVWVWNGTGIPNIYDGSNYDQWTEFHSDGLGGLEAVNIFDTEVEIAGPTRGQIERIFTSLENSRAVDLHRYGEMLALDMSRNQLLSDIVERSESGSGESEIVVNVEPVINVSPAAVDFPDVMEVDISGDYSSSASFINSGLNSGWQSGFEELDELYQLPDYKLDITNDLSYILDALRDPSTLPVVYDPVAGICTDEGGYFESLVGEFGGVTRSLKSLYAGIVSPFQGIGTVTSYSFEIMGTTCTMDWSAYSGIIAIMRGFFSLIVIYGFYEFLASDIAMIFGGS